MILIPIKGIIIYKDLYVAILVHYLRTNKVSEDKKGIFSAQGTSKY